MKQIKKLPVCSESHFEKYIIQKYIKNKLNITQCSKILNINYKTLWRIVNRNKLPIFFNRSKIVPANRIEFIKGQILHTSLGKPTKLIYLNRKIDKVGKEVRSFLFVRCSCGKEWWVNMSNIRNGGTKSCGQYPCKSIYHKIRDPETGYRCLLYSYKNHAKNRSLDFKITIEEAKILFHDNCYYCGIEPKQLYRIKDPITNKIRSGIPFLYNGIDRINSSKGYVLNNVVSCCKICNRAKSDLSLIQFKEWIVKLINFQTNGSSNSTCKI